MISVRIVGSGIGKSLDCWLTLGSLNLYGMTHVQPEVQINA